MAEPVPDCLPDLGQIRGEGLLRGSSEHLICIDLRAIPFNSNLLSKKHAGLKKKNNFDTSERVVLKVTMYFWTHDLINLLKYFSSE